MPSSIGRHCYTRLMTAVVSHGVLLSVLLGTWEWLGVRYGAFWFSRPSLVAQRLYEWATHGVLLYHLAITFQEVALGFLLGSAIGVVMAFLVTEVRMLSFLEGYLIAAYGIPRVALAPLFILWFGIGVLSKVAQAALMAMFVVFLNTNAGLRAVDKNIINVCRMFGATTYQIFTKVKMPSAFSYVVTGLRTAIPQALIGAVVAEFLSSNQGLGHLIQRSTNMLDTAGTFAGIVALMLVALALNSGLNRLERHLLRWRTSR